MRYILFSVLVFSYSCSNRKKYVFDNTIIGTVAKVTFIREKDDDKAQEIINKLWQEVSRLNKIFSTYLDTSELSLLNKHFSSQDFYKKIKISPELLYVIKTSVDIYNKTGHRFNIAIKSLEELWKNSIIEEKREPRQNELKALAEQIDLSKLIVSYPYISSKIKGMHLDLGGLAKGYIIDRLSELLEQKGITNYIVNIGGDLRLSGSKFNKAWEIYLQNPNLKAKHPYLMRCEFKNKIRAIATSGSYYRYMTLNGKRYSHIYDPHTLRPTRNDITSATIIAKTAIIADAYATAIFLMPYTKAVKFLDNSIFNGIILSKRGNYEKKTVNCHSFINPISFSSAMDIIRISSSL